MPKQNLPQQERPRDLPPGLWIVATPLGNLSDISDRARQALTHANRVLCEDTRRTAQLIQVLGLQRAGGGRILLERADAHLGPERLRRVLEWLIRGENLALVTDAGTPAISDPGAQLVAMAHEQGIRVTPVPGPSAVAALLSVAGFGETRFCFHGFFPRKASDRSAEVQGILELATRIDSRVHLWFESPQRIVEALQAIREALPEIAPLTRICAAKELTKAYETIFVGEIPQVLDLVRDHVFQEGAVGEWCFAILLPPQETLKGYSDQSSDWVKALQCLLEKANDETRITASEAAKRVSQYFGTPKKVAYEYALRVLGKK